jgi:broad specificity phosphatase PhoE
MSEKRSFYFVRHAQSEGNAKRIHQGHADFPLSDLGLKQANLLAERLASERIKPNLLLSSTLTRAYQTAEVISSRLGVAVELSHLWMERDSGDFNGMRIEDSRSIYTTEGIKPLYEPVGTNGESIWDLYFRAGQALQALLRNNQHEISVVVTHGGLLNMVFYHILGIPIQPDFRGPNFEFNNCSLSMAALVEGNQKWEIHTINDCSHLNNSS